MKSIYKLLCSLAFIACSLSASSQISVILTPSVVSVATGTPFYLDAQVTYNASCGTPSLQMILPANVSFMSVGAHPWGPTGSVVGSLLTVTFATPPVSGSVTTNFQINVAMAMGVICNGTVFPFRVNFVTANCGTVSSNTVNVTGTASLQYSMTVTKVDGGTCVGGYAFYDVAINSTGQLGAYNLTAPSIAFNTNGATVVGVGTVNYINIVTGSVPFTSCGVNVICFNPGAINIWTYGLRFRIGLKYPCGTFPVPYTGTHNVTLTGTNPCNTTSTLAGSVGVSLPISCCANPPTPSIISKTLLSYIGDFCPGSCQSSTYGLTFNNLYTGTPYSNATLEDAIPPQVNVTSIVSDQYNQYPYGTVQMFFQKNGAATWLGPVALVAGNTTTLVTSLPGWVGTDYLSRIRWNYSSIPTGVVINNNLNFSVINPDHNSNPVVAGNTVTNTLLGTASSPVLNATVNLPKTVSNCPLLMGRLKTVNGCAFSQNALPTNVVTFSLIIWNYGNQNITSIPITDVLNSNFTYVPGSDQYYYGNTFCPSPGAFSTLPVYNAGTPPTGSVSGPTIVGNTLSWNVPTLPGSCTSTNYFIIRFNVTVNNFTPAGTYMNNFQASSGYSNSVPVIVNNYYRADAVMEVNCLGAKTWDTTAMAKPGDIVRYRYKVRNIGNVPIDQIKLVNIKPMPGDFEVVNYATLRNSMYTIDYDCSYPGATVPAGASPIALQYESLGSTVCRNDLNLGFVPGSCTAPTWSAACNTTRSDLRVTINPAFVLMPGQDVDVVLQAIVGAGSIGDVANNSFGFVGRRQDLNIQTNPSESNLASVYIDAVGCTDQPPKDCHCGEWSDILWQYKPVDPNFPQNSNPTLLQCGSTITVACNNPISIKPQFSCIGPNCKATFTLTINNVNYPFNNISSSFDNIVFNASGVYNGVLVAYCGGKACDTCRFRIVVDCVDKACKCGKWKDITLTQNSQSTAVQCNGQYNVSCKKPLSIAFNYNCSGNCDVKYLVKLQPPAGPFTVLSGNTWNHTFTTPGFYTLTVIPICGGDTCEPCVIRFKVDCPQTDCNCGQWGDIVAIPKATSDGTAAQPIPLTCGKTYNVPCKTAFSIKPQYFCSGTNCTATFTLTINNVNYPFNIITNAFDNIVFTQSGIYTAVITPYCNGIACDPCIIYFNVKCDDLPPKDCCTGFQSDIHQIGLNYSGGSLHNLFFGGILVGGMIPNKMSITIVSATIANSNCNQNGPVAATITNVNANSTGLPNTLIINQPNGNDVTLSGNTWTNGGSVGLNLQVPLLPGCFDDLTVCVKITFYDKDCRACSIYKCVVVKRRWTSPDPSITLRR
jgi:uncharacterized repeat protein (TIGR01451 family)